MARPSKLPPDEQRAEIIEAAAKHLTTTNREHFRMVALAETLGMSHSNLYRFFPSREALFDAVIDTWLEDSRVTIKQAIASRSEPLDRIEAMLIAVHESSREKLTQDPSGFELYQHLFGARSASADKHIAFIVSTGLSLMTEAIEKKAVVIRDPLKAVVLIQAATVKFYTPEMVYESLHENTVSQLRAVLSALFIALRTDQHCLDHL